MGTDPDENLDKLCLYSGNSYTSLAPVGSKKPNAWGLYDMHGSLDEFCRDMWGSNLGAAEVTDPWIDTLPENGKRVVRGGTFRKASSGCRSASRSASNSATNESWWTNGFRLSCPAIAK